MWSLQAARLQALGQVFAPDLPGFGSEAQLPPADRNAAGYADWVAEQIRQRFGDRPIALAGYSLGGTVALQLTLRHKGLVTRLVLACSPPNWMRGWRGLFRFALARVVAPLGAEVFQTTVRLRVRWFSPEKDLRLAANDMVRRADRATMIALCRDLAGLDFRDALVDLDIPVLLVAGTRDFWFSPTEARETVGRLRDGRLRLFHGAGHMLCLSRAGEFSDVLAEFFCPPPKP